ncbi:MAG: hypothetical protein ABI632_12185 [Pseudolysinimonas sp.]
MSPRSSLSLAALVLATLALAGCSPASGGGSSGGGGGDDASLAMQLFGTGTDVAPGVTVTGARVQVADDAAADWYASFGYVATDVTFTTTGQEFTLLIDESRKCWLGNSLPGAEGLLYDHFCGDNYLVEYTVGGSSGAGGASSGAGEPLDAAGLAEFGWPEELPLLPAAYEVRFIEDFSGGQKSFSITYNGPFEDGVAQLKSWAASLDQFSDQSPADSALFFANYMSGGVEWGMSATLENSAPNPTGLLQVNTYPN